MITLTCLILQNKYLCAVFEKKKRIMKSLECSAENKNI